MKRFSVDTATSLYNPKPMTEFPTSGRVFVRRRDDGTISLEHAQSIRGNFFGTAMFSEWSYECECEVHRYNTSGKHINESVWSILS